MGEHKDPFPDAKAAATAADRHPSRFGKMELLAALAVAVVLLTAACGLALQSVRARACKIGGCVG